MPESQFSEKPRNHSSKMWEGRSLGPRRREAEGEPDDEHSQLKKLLLHLLSAPLALPIFPEMKWRRSLHLGELLPQTLKANVIKDMKKLESCALLMGMQNGVITMDKKYTIGFRLRRGKQSFLCCPSVTERSSQRPRWLEPVESSAMPFLHAVI